VYYRKRAEGPDVKAFMSAHEEILLDQNAIARQFGMFTEIRTLLFPIYTYWSSVSIKALL